MSTFAEINEQFREVMRRAKVDMTERLVTRILITVEGYAQAMTPIATGNLANSAFRNVQTTAGGVSGSIEYGAAYAGFVHEAPGTLQGAMASRSPASDGFVWGPNAEPGFLRKGIEQMISNDIDNLIRSEYRL